jgi:acyl carrier protein
VAPRTPLEAQLAEMWAEVLGLERVGIHDNFFELGGHSLLATQVISRLRDAFEVELPVRRFFTEGGTVAGLAELIETIRWAAQGVQDAPRAADGGREEGEL